MSEKEKIVVNIDEKYGQCLCDSCACGQTKISGSRKPQGFVEVYSVDKDGKKQKVGKSNLVVYLGRELVNQKIANTENPLSVVDKDEAIYWLGIGEGGVAGADPFVTDPPESTNTDLLAESPVHASDSTNCTDLRVGNYYKHKVDTIAFEQDTDNNNKWLIVKITTTLGVDDAVGYDISEAGLFTSVSSQPGSGNAGPFHLFARVTFSTIQKTSTRELIFVWYLYT